MSDAGDAKSPTSSLPLLVSVPHAGLWVPAEVEEACALRKHEVLEDGDVGAAEIFWPLESHVAEFLTTDVARAIVDLNRAEDDRRKDGVVKTHTCWNVPVYNSPLCDDEIELLIERYHRPYHRDLTERARPGVILGIDCHTMAARGPEVGPDPGRERPSICLGNAGGVTCPQAWIELLRAVFLQVLRDVVGATVSMDDPFRGGHITRSHAAEMPWVQLEVSRAPFLSNEEKAARVSRALTVFCERVDLGIEW